MSAATTIQLRQAEPEPANLPSRFSIPELQMMAKAVAASRMFPGVDNEQSAFTLMLLCESEGLHPMQAVRRFHIIKGRPTMRADAMQAEYQRKGGVIRWDRTDSEVCEATFFHPTHAPDPGVAIRFTIEDAKRAGLLGNENWKKWPDAMLRARVISSGVRMVLPGVVVGIYTEADLPDHDDRPALPPARRPEPAAIRATDMPVVGQDTSAGPDSRIYPKVVADACEATGNVLQALDAHWHLWWAAKAEGLHDGQPDPKTKGAALKGMVEVYRHHRAWVREELATFLDEKVREAAATVDPPSPDDTIIDVDHDDISTSEGGRGG